MARTRLLKPDFFTDEDLADLPFEARLLFAGLWTIADRAGRLEDRPKRIKAHLFPYDAVDVDALLAHLERGGFVARYTVEDASVIQIRTFVRHQHPHHKEVPSVLPENPNKFQKPRLGRGPTVPSPGPTPTLPLTDPSDTLDPDTLDPDALDPDPLTKAQPSVVPTSGFEVFWRAYPRKVGKDAAKKVWQQRKPDLQTVLDALAWQTSSDAWTKDGGSFIPHPATYLRQGRWQDERPVVAAPPAPTNKRIAGLLAGGAAFLKRMEEES